MSIFAHLTIFGDFLMKHLKLNKKNVADCDGFLKLIIPNIYFSCRINNYMLLKPEMSPNTQSVCVESITWVQHNRKSGVDEWPLQSCYSASSFFHNLLPRSLSPFVIFPSFPSPIQNLTSICLSVPLPVHLLSMPLSTSLYSFCCVHFSLYFSLLHVFQWL